MLDESTLPDSSDPTQIAEWIVREHSQTIIRCLKSQASRHPLGPSIFAEKSDDLLAQALERCWDPTKSPSQELARLIAANEIGRVAGFICLVAKNIMREIESEVALNSKGVQFVHDSDPRNGAIRAITL